MKFLDRALRLIRADAHGVVDHLEESSLLLKQHLREAEVEVTRKRVRVESLEREEQQITEAVDRLERQLRKLDEDVELALAGDKEELARFAVKRLLPVRASLTALRERGEMIHKERVRIADRLAQQEEQYEELCREVKLRLAAAQREKAARDADLGAGAIWDADSTLAGSCSASASDEEVELELLRRRGLTAGEGA